VVGNYVRDEIKALTLLAGNKSGVCQALLAASINNTKYYIFGHQPLDALSELALI
jgi:hypothetical protein